MTTPTHSTLAATLGDSLCYRLHLTEDDTEAQGAEVTQQSHTAAQREGRTQACCPAPEYRPLAPATLNPRCERKARTSLP